LTTVARAFHVALLDPLTGDGALVLPRPVDDLPCPFGGPSAHAADELAILAELDCLGWEPTEGEDGERFCVDYCLPDGREVVGLYGREPIISTPSLRQQAEAGAELRRRVVELCTRRPLTY